MERGPIYSVELIDTLPMNPRYPDSMLQQMPSRGDLDAIREDHTRVAAGYEVLLQHYRESQARLAAIREQVQYWSYCTSEGMRATCPEKVDELADFMIDLKIAPWYIGPCNYTTGNQDGT